MGYVPGRRELRRLGKGCAMPTMADVARSAGVSVATVSHVLNGTRPVLPHTRQAVLDAVDALGYTPNTLARSLVTSRTRSIGLAVSVISNPYFTEILQGVEAAALEAGYSLLVADPHDDPLHERKVVEFLHERRVDGMIVAPPHSRTTSSPTSAATPCRPCSSTGWWTSRSTRTARVPMGPVPSGAMPVPPASIRSAARTPHPWPGSSPTSPGWAIAGSGWSRGCPG